MLGSLNLEWLAFVSPGLWVANARCLVVACGGVYVSAFVGVHLGRALSASCLSCAVLMMGILDLPWRTMMSGSLVTKASAWAMWAASMKT